MNRLTNLRIIQKALFISIIIFCIVPQVDGRERRRDSHAQGANKPFVVGDLMGQLGNQMFIIAATTSLALDHDAIPIFPALLNDDQYNLPFNYANVFYHLNASDPTGRICKTYREEGFNYSPIPYTPNMMIRGWFQSEKYFYHHKQEIVSLFAPRPEIVDYLQKHYFDILDHPNTVSIHYRSYHIEDPDQQVYIDCGEEYYRKAIDQFPEENALFVVFSNDMSRCKAMLASIDRPLFFVEGEPYHIDFYLMSRCHHNIICNSSFSWWAAYLNPNLHKRVIAPPKWFNLITYYRDESDLIPREWIRL